MNLLAADFGTGQILWDMLWFFLFIIWFWLLITVFSDIFRSHDMGGFAKALWVIFVVILPYLGVFVYLIARGGKMQEHAAAQVQRQNDAATAYIQNVAGQKTSPAEELARLADLRDKGVLSEAEFQAAKAKALA
jgi:hypothetical protein